MRTKRGIRSIIGVGVCAALLAVVRTACFQPRQPVQPAAYNSINRLQLLSRSEPLVRVLLPDNSRLEATTYQNTTYTSSGQTVHNLSIDYNDPISGDAAHLLWNADTGELMHASRFRPKDPFAEFDAKSSRSAAVALAWDWFRAMKIGHGTEEWQIVGERKKPYAQWDIYLRAGERTVIMTVSTCSGKLIQTVCSRLPDPKMAWAPIKSGMPS